MASVELLTCAGCGGEPKFQHDRVTYGQGDCPIVWVLACKCGIRTKEIPQQYAVVDDSLADMTEEICQGKCAAIWNRVMARDQKVVGEFIAKKRRSDDTDGLATAPGPQTAEQYVKSVYYPDGSKRT